MKNKIKNIPLSVKISGIFIMANIFSLVVIVVLLLGINSLSRRMEESYQDNLHLNEAIEALDNLQRAMTEYLNSKSTDSLSDYYSREQAFSGMVRELNERITDRTPDRMERNIKFMSEDYLERVAETIEAKRGRNIEKYRTSYEETNRQYEYIKAYMRSLNEERFAENSARYTALARNFRRFEFLAMSVMIVVLLGSAFLITGLTGTIIYPLRELARTADEVSNANFDVELPASSGSDEVGRLNTAFRKMLISIRDYIDRLRTSMENEQIMQKRELMMETHLKDAQLKYLQAQINPHFLFNTLNAGAQLAMMEGADRTYEYVQTVADFFRYNVKKLDAPVTIEEEVNLVDAYISILNVRFSGDIHYDRQVDKRLLNVKMPGMILQPIVENAVNHGIREMGDRGHIDLKVYRDEDRVYISVRDNGKGMSPEDIEKVVACRWESDEKKSDGGGIAMDNVISRLKLYAGREDVVEIRSGGSDQGTEVIINFTPHEDEEIEDGE
ncbi:MAG: histidine kinase [Lachnospiraceae bacterium]|jgi:sensor histidine kinase YesM|nr:histidine kinase [Lachnospiraceae bacterium]